MVGRPPLSDHGQQMAVQAHRLHRLDTDRVLARPHRKDLLLILRRMQNAPANGVVVLEDLRQASRRRVRVQEATVTRITR